MNADWKFQCHVMLFDVMHFTFCAPYVIIETLNTEHVQVHHCHDNLESIELSFCLQQLFSLECLEHFFSICLSTNIWHKTLTTIKNNFDKRTLTLGMIVIRHFTRHIYSQHTYNV